MLFGVEGKGFGRDGRGHHRGGYEEAMSADNVPGLALNLKEPGRKMVVF